MFNHIRNLGLSFYLLLLIQFHLILIIMILLWIFRNFYKDTLKYHNLLFNYHYYLHLIH